MQNKAECGNIHVYVCGFVWNLQIFLLCMPRSTCSTEFATIQVFSECGCDISARSSSIVQRSLCFCDPAYYHQEEIADIPVLHQFKCWLCYWIDNWSFEKDWGRKESEWKEVGFCPHNKKAGPQENCNLYHITDQKLKVHRATFIWVWWH